MLTILPPNFTFEILLDCGFSEGQLKSYMGNGGVTKLSISSKGVTSFKHLKEQAIEGFKEPL